MAYFIQHGRVVYGKTGRAHITEVKLVAKFPNDYHFNFNIANPDNWKKFLRNFRTRDGKLLPRRTKEGDPVAYYVFMLGVPTYMRDALPDQKYYGYYCCFPGERIRQNKKDFLVPNHGRID